ncbi:MAG: SusC/RagA family TonB-linked outer membrane protein [Bacteroidales bacterium]
MYHKCRIIIKVFVIPLLLVTNVLCVKAQVNEGLQQTTIRFSSAVLNLQKALEELNTLPEVSVDYSNIALYGKIFVRFSSNPIAVKEALKEIEAQAPVNLSVTGNHIMVKYRKPSGDYKISGSITDSETNINLFGVNVYIKGTTIGTVTDGLGKFTLQMGPGQYTLVCKYIGYKTEEIFIRLYNDVDLSIGLYVTPQEIEAVNVIGKKRDIEMLRTGRTIETIESQTIEQLSTNDLNDVLHGRVTGVWTTKVSGAPGDHNKIRIRGISSIFGSTDPLYVVDGTIIPVVNFMSLGISDLNVHDVDNITILKDASSNALYGYLGGNGVVLIETKKGGGETRFSAGVKTGFQQFTKRYSLMNSEEFYHTLELSDKLIYTPFYTRIIEIRPPKYELYPDYLDSLGNTLGYDNFQEKLFNTGVINEFQLSGTGNFKTIDFYVSGNYYAHKGVVTHSLYDKYTFTGNFSKIFKDKASLRLLYKGSHLENKNNLDNYLSNNVILKGINYEPAYYYTPDSFLKKLNRLFYSDNISQSVKTLSAFFRSPDLLFNEQEKKKVENNNSVSMHGYYRLNKTLSFRSVHSLALKNFAYSSFLPSHYYQPEEKYLSSHENYIIINQQYDLNFERELSHHKLDILVRFRNYNDNIYWETDSVKSVDLNSFNREDDIYLRGSQVIYGEKGSVIRSINSFIAGLSYNYKSKYFISLIANIDHLKEGHFVKQKALFSSIALDWDLAKEEWFGLPSWANAFHIYANWGKSGNYPLNSLSDDLFYTGYTYSSNDTIVSAVEISNLANHYLMHEEVTESNFGTKISLFKNSINITADYYIKYNTNLLLKREIPFYYGGGFFYQNIGKMETKGVELSLEVVPFNRRDFYWSSKIGYSSNNQIITNLFDGRPISFNHTDILFPDFYAKENEALGSITGFSCQGLWVDSIHSVKNGKFPRFVKDNDLAYLKIDTVVTRRLTENDKVVIGNSIPKFTCHWINQIEYRNFSCDMLWYAVIGVDKYNATKASTYITGLNEEVGRIVRDTLSYIKSPAFYQSSFFVEDASFIRLKSLSLSYRQPKKIASKISITYAVTFENLFTITKYSGYDPEATIYTNNNFTDNAMDRGAYPNPRGYYFSINLSF